MKFISGRDSGDRIGNGHSRAVLSSADDTQLLQELSFQGFASEAQQTIENAHPYGFVSHPKKPSMIGGVMRHAVAFLSFLNGNRSHGVAFAVGDRRYRLYKTQEGEVALHDDQGQVVYLQRGGILATSPFQVTVQVGGSANNGQQMGQDATKLPAASTSVVLTTSALSDTSPGVRNITAKGKITITAQGDDIIVDPSGNNVWLGGSSAKGDVFAQVMTQGGPSPNVYAKIG